MSSCMTLRGTKQVARIIKAAYHRGALFKRIVSLGLRFRGVHASRHKAGTHKVSGVAQGFIVTSGGCNVPANLDSNHPDVWIPA